MKNMTVELLLLILILLNNGLIVLGATNKRLNSGCADNNYVQFEHEVETRIKNGFDAEPAQFPFIVSLQAELNDTFILKFCSGSILSNRLIITANHCLKDSGFTFYAVAGMVNYPVNALHTQIRTLDQIFLHPFYVELPRGPIMNDIAFATVDKPFVFTPYVQPIPVPGDDFQLEGTGLVAGWGLTDYRRNAQEYFSNVLHYTTVNIVPIEDCQRFWPSANAINHICAYGNQTNACRYDSGGPLVQKVNGVTTLVGLVSFGEHCIDHNTPVLYVNVHSFLPYIKAFLNSLG